LWHDPSNLPPFYTHTLIQTCAYKPADLVSLASSSAATHTHTHTHKDPHTQEGQLDLIMSSLNFFRFCLLKKIDTDTHTHTHTQPLIELQGKIKEILVKEHHQKAAFQLSMVEEVVGSILVLLEAHTHTHTHTHTDT
jgi:hypothetical protein